MRFLLAFVLVFVSVFASAQAPMVLGGPQGIDVTRILARNWMSIPIYIDTPAAPLTGSGWPGKGYIIQVAKVGDTSVWQYTGQRWAKIAGASQETYTKLVTGGDVNQLGLSRQYTVSPSTYFINGVYYNLTTQQTVTSPVKTANANARIDVIALTTTGATVVQGTERPVPLKPSVGPNRLELAAIYYPAFDTVSREISEGGLTSVFRILGRDSIYFTSGDSVVAVKDSIGISKNDTAAMLNPYKFTAANGLTKDSTVFRLGGSLNQNTNINLNTRRLTFIGGADTTRFYANGKISIAGTPDSTGVHWLINKKGSRLGNLEILSGQSAGITGQGIRIDGTDQPFNFQGTSSSGIPATFKFVSWLGDTVPAQISNILLARDIINVSQGFTRFSAAPALDTARANVLHIQPKYNIFYDSGHTVVRGIYYNPTLQALNKSTHIAYQNTTGSNLLNSSFGNTRIGYNTSDTTFKLDVNGNTRILNNLLVGTSTDNNYRANIVGNVLSNGNGLYARGYTALKVDYVNDGNTILLAGLSNDSSSVVVRTGNIADFYRTMRIFGGRTGDEIRVNNTFGANINQDTTALFEITSTNAGFLQPRMTNVQRDSISSSPTTGLQLFSTTDSANYVYRGTGGGWQKIANEISGSATLDFPSTNGSNKSDLTITVTGAAEGDVVSLGVPNGSVLDHSCYTAWVSATNQVTVRFSNYGTGALDPASGVFKVKVFK